jgi:hypothetical protein
MTPVCHSGLTSHAFDRKTTFELRTALASIPHIYATLDVVTLMPGSPCKCLQEGLDAFGGYNVGETDQVELDRQSVAWTED